MTIPGNLNTREVTGTYILPDGDPPVTGGYILFTPVIMLTDYISDTIILPDPLKVYLESDGTFSVTLPCTDDTDLTPSGWAWKLEEHLPGGQSFMFELPYDGGASIDRAELVPAENNSDPYTAHSHPDQIGPIGPTGATGPEGPTGGFELAFLMMGA